MGSALKKGEESQRRLQRRSHVVPYKRDQCKDGEKAINDARYRCQQFDKEGKPVGDPRRSKFCQKNRSPYSQRDTENQGQSRSHQCSVYEWQCAEFERNGIPCDSGEESPTKFGA